MAMTTTSTVPIPCRPSPFPSSSSSPLNTALAVHTKPRRSILIACSSGDNSTETNTGAAAATAAAAAESSASESSIEAPDVPPSLISALNVERALRGIAITDVDHYGRLGIPRKCPYDQVAGAYKKKVEEAKSEGLEEEELNEKLEQLKESYRILSTVEERRLYDWSLARSEKPDRYMWPFEPDITQTPTQSPPPPVLESDCSIFSLSVLFLCPKRNRRMRGRRDSWVTSCLDGWYCPSYYQLPSIDDSSHDVSSL